jgi:hypothetical protein
MKTLKNGFYLDEYHIWMAFLVRLFQPGKCLIFLAESRINQGNKKR